MNVKELIGKVAIRTTYVTYTDGHTDDLFTSNPIVIQEATDTHIIYTHCEPYYMSDDKTHILPDVFCDNNWIAYKKVC